MRTLTQVSLLLAMIIGWGCKDRPEGREEVVKAGERESQPKKADGNLKSQRGREKMGEEIKVESIVAQFVPVELGVDEGKIPAQHKPVLKKLVEAAQIVDRLFFNQVSDNNESQRRELAKDPASAKTLELFDIMYGPWNRLDHNKPFIGAIAKPKGATFYPKDLTRDELEKWMETHPDQKATLSSYFTVVRRDENNGLVALPYAEVYKEYLEPAAKLLAEAAELSADKRLKKYLNSRAASFRSNEYRESDMDWMNLGDGDLEIVIGPYEVYEDELMGYKAAFEAFITLRSRADSKKVAQIKRLIPDMQAFLPLPEEHKKNNRGSALPISVVDAIYTAGDTRAGVQTMAFNLPNDEVVREKKGFKLVFLKNISHAKYNKILIPIAKQLMREDQVVKVSFDAFFNHALVHETAHGLGPGRITVDRNGKKIETTVNAELKDLYAAIEETKADILGTYLNYLLIEKGLLPEDFMETAYATLLAGFFRSIRFGAGEAHGKGNLVQFNWLAEKGAITHEKNRFVYHSEKMRGAIESLTKEVLMIEALGDYDRAKRLLKKYGNLVAPLNQVLRGLVGVPTDLNPSFRVEKQMIHW